MSSFHRILLWCTFAVVFVCPLLPCHAAAAPAQEDKETDKAQMRQVWEALMAYKEAKGKLPDFLSDLVPEYIPDKATLLSPVEKRTGRKGNNGQDDPKLPCSYCYEFSGRKFFNDGGTFREFKEAQMEEFGPVIPILRCFSYGNTVLNVAYSGDVYETPLMWEVAPQTQELIKKLGLGPGGKNGVFTELKVIDEAGKPVADAAVELTGRNEGYGLPSRTLKTDQSGSARVRLASKEASPHRVVVKVTKPGHFALSENWDKNSYAKERQITLSSTTAVGGVVKMKDGSPLSGAEISVKLVAKKPDTRNSEHALSLVKADNEGRWKCEAVPKNFGTLAFTVKHPSVSSAQFSSTADAGSMSRDALLAGTSEFLIAPSPVISGMILGSDGNPVANAEVLVCSLVLKSINNGENGAPPDEIDQRAHQSVKTDHQGNFSLPWPDEEKVVITVFAENHAPAQQIVAASSAQTSLKIALESGRVTSGQLSDYDGKPVSGAGVYLFMLGKNGVPGRKQIAKTDAEGRYSWSHAPSRPMTLLFLHEGHAGSLVDVTASGSNEAKVKIGKVSNK